MKTYEVFLKKAGKEPFGHAGSLDAPDDHMALLFARDSYGRRSEGEQIWVVSRDHILEGNQSDLALINTMMASEFLNSGRIRG
jgi:ring-1,2-phenylacetyl-CoA epoxidase subunit PaaB